MFSGFAKIIRDQHGANVCWNQGVANYQENEWLAGAWKDVSPAIIIGDASRLTTTPIKILNSKMLL